MNANFVNNALRGDILTVNVQAKIVEIFLLALIVAVVALPMYGCGGSDGG